MNALTAATGPSSAVFARSVREGLRDPGPALFLPALPPLLLVIAMTSLFGRLNGVIAFPTGSFKEFFVPGAIMIVAIAGGGFTSAQVAEDLRSGFIDRLRLQVRGPLILLLGRFGFEAIRIIPGVAAVLCVGLLFGGALPNGLPGALVITLLAMLLSAAYAGLFYIAAIVTEDPQTPLNLNPVGIIVSFLSTAFIPRAAMPSWADTAAGLNPVTVIVDGARAAMIGDLTSATVAAALAVATAGVAISVVASGAVLNRKLSRG
ncbi:ABC transporter permease [Streptomyces albicerus]|uniref:ABC transporter permease n=1 Tax=Streptomyces albicerus TaxID=2569859 RepID=UPI00124AEAD7|nr:ABC transporter permease [Streptomyces albicerus]